MSALLDVEHLQRTFNVSDGRSGRRQVIRAVDDISFGVDRGETLALVGESGCGKSTTGLATLRLIEPSAGSIHLDGTDIRSLSSSRLREMRSRMQIVLQNPRSQLDPRMKVADSVAEPLYAHGDRGRDEVRDRVSECLELVGLRPDLADRYPRRLSGGQRQRVAIARAISTNPDLIVLDEAVSALDVSVQTQVMNLLRDLQEKLGTSYLFISHSMSAVRYLAHRVVVMYMGRDVETAPAEDFFAHPAHPYSAALLSAVPDVTGAAVRERIVLPGDVPSPFNVPSGCVFRSRCPQAQELCAQVVPPQIPVGAGREVACHFPLLRPQTSDVPSEV